MASKKQPPKGRAGKATPAPPPLVASRADKVVKKAAPKKAPKKAVAKKAKPKKPAARKATPRKAAPKGNFITRSIRWLFRTFFKIIWWFTWRGALLGSFILALWVGYYYVQLPPLEDQLDGRSRGSVRLLDRYGNIFAWRGEQFDGSLRAQTVSPDLKNAVIATEDKRFYSHFGISPRGIASAIRINLREGRGPLSGHGGSTITQQVAKLLCLGDADKTEAECRRGSLWRKLQEMPFSFALELKYSKDDILSIYLNRAYLGAGAYGFEAAAQRYFAKSARDLTPSESAMLAGLLTAPSRFAPTRNLERAQARASVVIGLMQDQDYLTRVEAEIALARPATLSRVAQTLVGGDYADWIMTMDGDEVLQAFTRDTAEDVTILTSFDPDIQRAAVAALENIFATKVSASSNAQAAIVVMSADGAVRAVVGGRNIEGDYFNRATQARRQTGSAFKPFVYAAALEAGWSPNAIVEDAPLTINVPGSGPYSPQNYNRRFGGLMTLTEAMAKSINTVAVRVSEEVGRERVRAMAMDFGITSDIATGPAVALGVTETSLLEMTGAYAGFLNGGRLSRPFGMLDLTLSDGTRPFNISRPSQGRRVLSELADGYLIYMLNQVVETGTGHRAQIDGWQMGGKTGTTQGAKDAWFIGFTADYVAGVWMGYDNNTPLTGVTGSGLPAQIWKETMQRVHEGRTPRPLPMIIPPEPRPIEQVDTPVEERRARTILDLLLGTNR
ncbi:MAG: penicillin-binding protein [Rhodobacteraceae bacterium]|nr:penicillin-binding protein [Paracoccaceae bacterium]